MIDPFPSSPIWLDAPRPDPDPAGHDAGAATPATVEAALDALATAIASAQGDASRRVATYLAKDPGKSSFDAIAAQLADPRLLAFLERMSAAASPDASGLLTGLFRRGSGPARPAPCLDGLARSQILRRMLDETRVAALARACAAAPATQSGDPA